KDSHAAIIFGWAMSKLDSLLTTNSASWREMLEARAVQNEAAEIESEEDGSTILNLKTKRPSFFFPPLSWLIRSPDKQRVSLDRLGTEVWRLCDGRTVEQIIDLFAEQHGLTFHEARVAVTSYMKSLVERGALAIVVTDAS
ncbi:MAG: PqqD family peptide modification chaperone, partial [Planctomycetota bacterium]|nr:PqqD family peptide modification chaperone [Planctomycetota bacterium]